MNIVRKMLGDMDITRDIILLLTIGGLYSLSISLSNTFVNVFLWKQSGDYVSLAIYNLAIVVLQPLTFILAGRWAKHIDRVVVLRIGVIFLALFFVAVLFIGEKSSNYLVLLGSILGIGYGFYWLAFNVLTFEITEPETRDFFNGFMGALASVGGIIGPISAGFIITRFISNVGYTIIFSLSLALFTIAVFASFYLKRRSASGKYVLKAVLSERKRNYNWRLITNSHFLQGTREGTFIFVISVFIFLSAKSELGLGAYGLLHAGIAFVFYTLASRFIKKDKRKLVMMIGGIMLYAAIFIMIFDPTYTKLLIYGAVVGIAYPLMLVPYASMTYDAIGKSTGAAEMRVEYIVVRELFLNGGRICSILIFIAATFIFNVEKVLPYLLLVLGLGHTLAALTLLRMKTE